MIVGQVFSRHSAVLVHYDELFLEEIVQSCVDDDEDADAKVLGGEIYLAAGLGKVLDGNERANEGEGEGWFV
jgi:hypothetical protein